MAHCITPNFKHQNAREQTEDAEQTNERERVDHQLEALLKLNANAMKFFQNFIHTRHPTTVCWLLEILLLLTHKFKPQGNKLDKRLKAEYTQLFDSLLRSAAAILSDSFGIRYTEAYGINQICFSPTVHEMLKRYEFTKLKQRELIEHEEAMPAGNNAARPVNYSHMGQAGRSQFGQASTASQRARERNVNPNLTFPRSQLDAFDEIPLQKGSMFAEMPVVRDPREIYACGDMTDFMRELNRYLHVEDDIPDEAKQKDIFKALVTVTLRQNLTQLSAKIHPAADEKDGRVQSESIIVQALMKVLDSQIRGVEKAYKPEVQVYAEFLTDLLACLANESATLDKQFKGEVTQLFYQDSFFLMSERTLRKWQIIMRHYLNRNPELFEELLKQFRAAEGLFVSTKREVAQKSLTFKRLAFLVYSSNIDSFDE